MSQIRASTIVCFTACGLFVASTIARAQLADAGPVQAEHPSSMRHVDERAEILLQRMFHTLRAMKTLRFTAEQTSEVVTKDGQKLQLVADSSLSLQRPNKLRSDRSGGLLDASLFYDGHTMTIYGQRANLYTQVDAPRSVDEALEFARSRLGIEAPAANLLRSNPVAALLHDVVSGLYIGKVDIGGRTCHHLAFRARTRDFQIWIADGDRALPCRYAVTYKDQDHAPQFVIEFKTWDVNPKFARGTFRFQPPATARKFDADAARREEVASSRKAGTAAPAQP